MSHGLPSLSAAMQTVGQKDGFQRCYPDRASAEAAYDLFEEQGIYPDYGKSPWVVFHGRKTGVVSKMSVLLFRMTWLKF